MLVNLFGASVCLAGLPLAVSTLDCTANGFKQGNIHVYEPGSTNYNKFAPSMFSEFSTAEVLANIKFVVSPTNEAEAKIVLDLANKCKIRVLPRGGGHSYLGASVYTEQKSIVLRMKRFVPRSSQKTINIDTVSGTATVGAGVILGEMYEEIHQASTPSKTFHLAGGTCPTVGIGIIFGGGKGYYSRKHGYLCDSVKSMRVVVYKNGKFTAVTASTTTNEDLYYALLGGGGGNFGLVTEVTFELIRLYNDKDGNNVITFYKGGYDPNAASDKSLVGKFLKYSTSKVADSNDVYTRIQVDKSNAIGFHALCECSKTGCENCVNAMNTLNGEMNGGQINHGTAYSEAFWEGGCHGIGEVNSLIDCAKAVESKTLSQKKNTVHKSMNLKTEGLEANIKTALARVKESTSGFPMFEVDVVGGKMKQGSDKNSYPRGGGKYDFNLQVFDTSSSRHNIHSIYNAFKTSDIGTAYPDYPDPELFNKDLAVPKNLHKLHYHDSPDYESFTARYTKNITALENIQCKYNSIDMFRFANYVGSIKSKCS
uniref:FAD-binding PCMH-type domain-containing protein n=1 Tax=Mucochytrium quahogii TaxID=96639 RepID=A0A7S2SEK9_9STRA|mmetsp:Transcript_1920/g.3377  ORF Transcript_1920/g.3377 Transcript_1920/m.3377 type:complete len:539 (+) Transcript_1920:2130-3746(+)|eukprot:CAMPEP_0203756792 /NCGR_PEP_ID=MMETSP0098-20131031/9987_1 /ASSEMBLY_ACC=CAM_ASM_000208 /TAXON_ID=96639 /ORGANISM=" , Strain NY0313808BC1" /LENGTH=538 /DNA_ID=CAMNT_0050648791 /DNA_START=878 /DNA_END=2494 /DNA_ORIENTATION=+